MNRIPKLAIGIPVYNGENYLGETLDLLLRQTYGDFEIIVSDNCSTDRTAELCLDYAAKDQRILYTKTERNIGGSPNFNRVFTLARSPYFTWKAHDDRSRSHLPRKMRGGARSRPGRGAEPHGLAHHRRPRRHATLR